MIEKVTAVRHSQLDVSTELPKHVLEHGHHPPLWAREDFPSPANQTSMDLINSSRVPTLTVKTCNLQRIKPSAQLAFGEFH